MKTILLSLVIMLIATMLPVSAESFTGKVISVADGNTLMVVSNNRAVKIRPAGVDAPDLDQAYGPQAREFLENLVKGKNVWVDVKKQDHYRRLVAPVIVDGLDVSVALAAAGMAWYDSKTAGNGQIAMADAEAQAKKIGLWSQPNPIPPWDFRQQRRGPIPNAVMNGGGGYQFQDARTSPSSSSAGGKRTDYGFVPVQNQSAESTFQITQPMWTAPPPYRPYW